MKCELANLMFHLKNVEQYDKTKICQFKDFRKNEDLKKRISISKRGWANTIVQGWTFFFSILVMYYDGAWTDEMLVVVFSHFSGAWADSYNSKANEQPKEDSFKIWLFIIGIKLRARI